MSNRSFYETELYLSNHQDQLCLVTVFYTIEEIEYTKGYWEGEEIIGKGECPYFDSVEVRLENVLYGYSKEEYRDWWPEIEKAMFDHYDRNYRRAS